MSGDLRPFDLAASVESMLNTKAQADDEALDLLVCVYQLALARGINHILWAAGEKIWRTTLKYRLQGGEKKSRVQQNK